MSSEKDNYYTPAWVVNALLENHPITAGTALEPCAGSGAIIQAFKNYLQPAPPFAAVEIRPEEREALKRVASLVYIEDFLKWEPLPMIELIVTNPPFSIAQQVIERALEIADGKAEVIMLLQLAFLEAEKRFAFWQKHLPSRVYVLSARPSFTGDGGTDHAAYAWFTWNSGPGQVIKVIDSPTRPRKRGGARGMG